jgi:carboxymethylenebutenolidase
MAAELVSETVQVTTRDGVADAYLVRHAGEPRPGVLFLMDAFGVRPAIEEMADRIAAEGYAVLAPNLFYSAGRDALGPMPDLTDPDMRARFFEKVRPLMAELTPVRLASDGAAYLDCLGEAAAPGRVALTGYCMGGRVGWWIARAHPYRVAALAAFHPGGLVAGTPESPHRAAGEVSAELYFGFADGDPSMTAEQISEFERTLDGVGARYRSEVYEGARHGYTMADTAAYDEDARERHFRELHALLARTLG